MLQMRHRMIQCTNTIRRRQNYTTAVKHYKKPSTELPFLQDSQDGYTSLCRGWVVSISNRAHDSSSYSQLGVGIGGQQLPSLVCGEPALVLPMEAL